MSFIHDHLQGADKRGCNPATNFDTVYHQKPHSVTLCIRYHHPLISADLQRSTPPNQVEFISCSIVNQDKKPLT